MGKASRWLVNFLSGRKEDKEKGKRKNISYSFEEERVTSPSATPTASHFKRRWSFGKLGSKEKARKSSRSLDSVTGTPLVKQAVLDLQSRHEHDHYTRPIFALLTRTGSKRRGTKAAYEAALISRAIEDAAATRIQAAFRAHLARKALHALRGLVKLQALVRGHLVRKQTTATLRQMHALMAIQVRARFQRLQTAEEPKLAIKSHSSRYGRYSQELGFKRPEREPVDMNLYEKHATVKSQNGYTNHSKIKRIEHGITTFYSGELSISKREQRYEEFSFTTHNSPRHPPQMSRPSPGRSSFSSHEHPFTPNYMANTESSRAKFRSQSEPKQRPAMNYKAKGKKTASVEEIDDNIEQHYSSSQWNGVAEENQEPWLVKGYRSTRTPNYNEGYTSGRASYSEYRKSLVRDEPHATLF